ncbi:PLDc_N domain-containing protein [Verrucomicrobiaceae bacterium 5K15]|uniref:PLDc_N domain-containing protein n=1 Tax=Oceaniferula flava TaxID=2800421 RepID=A0AAE2V7S5_9BACT|nr:PLD nuclease N-terminal domain-containing protein [Oceaniferula flavus]MBK1854307.1 PLDc_N domain-containing protein [Oceaniferula flavus]MBM1135613.1 PLDc_N domain-containing protein [Oceaniferula flavus]
MTMLFSTLAQAEPNGSMMILPALLFFAIGIAFVVFWIWTLVDCIKNEPSEGNDKIVWVLVIALAGWIGALIYLLARRPTRKRELGR